MNRIRQLMSWSLGTRNVPATFKERQAQLGSIVLRVLPKVMQTILKECMSPRVLQVKYRLKDIRATLTEYEISLLEKLPNMDEFTIELCYKILRYENLMLEPSCKWGNTPYITDVEIADDIQRIVIATNEVIGKKSEDVSETYYEGFQKRLHDILNRVDKFLHQVTCIKLYKTICKDEVNTIDILQELALMQQIDRRRKVRVQIIFQNNADIERTIDILNSLKDEINENLSGIEFIVATKGSIILDTDIFLEILETDALLQSTLTIFLQKILERITISNTESIDMVLLPVEEYTQWKVSKPIGEPVFLDFDILAGFFETDDKMEEQLRQLSDAFSKHSNESGTNNDITATLLPICLENKPTASAAFIQAQTPVKYNLPVYVTLRKQLNIKRSSNENHNITSCIKIGTALVMLVFTDCYNKRLIICNSDGAAIHHIPLSCRPYYITEVDNNTVAVSSTLDRTILIINISRSSVTNTINTSGYCYGISYDDNNLHVVIDISIIQVMDLTGKVIRTIPLPSGSIRDITVDRDRFVCRDFKSIYCCSLDGKLLWKFEKDKYQDLRRVTTDNERNVFVADSNYSVVVVSDDGEYYREILTKSDGLNRPGGIYFDKKENILLVCNLKDGKAFLFDVKKKLS